MIMINKLDQIVKWAKIIFVIGCGLSALLMVFGIFFIPYAYHNPVKGFISGEMSALQDDPFWQYVFENGYYPGFVMLAGYAVYYILSMGTVTFLSLRDNAKE
jgi:hypothetical protein